MNFGYEKITLVFFLHIKVSITYEPFRRRKILPWIRQTIIKWHLKDIFKEKCSKIIVIKIHMQRKDKRTSDWKRYLYKRVKMYGFIYKKQSISLFNIFIFWNYNCYFFQLLPHTLPLLSSWLFSLIVTYIHTYS